MIEGNKVINSMDDFNEDFAPGKVLRLYFGKDEKGNLVEVTDAHPLDGLHFRREDGSGARLSWDVISFEEVTPEEAEGFRTRLTEAGGRASV